MLWTKKCFYCCSDKDQKYGHVKGVQRYRCWACGKQFLGGNRIDVAELCRECSELKQTYAHLAEKYGCSPRTIKRKLDTYTPPKGTASPGRVVVVMDTTYWERKYGVMLFKDALTHRDLLWYFIRNETNDLYVHDIAELERMGYERPTVMFDGRKRLPKMFPDKKVQLCQFHQQRTVRNHNGIKRKRRDMLVIVFLRHRATPNKWWLSPTTPHISFVMCGQSVPCWVAPQQSPTPLRLAVQKYKLFFTWQKHRQNSTIIFVH